MLSIDQTCCFKQPLPLKNINPMQLLILLSQVLPPSTLLVDVHVQIFWLKLVSCDLLVALPNANIISLNLNTAQIVIQNSTTIPLY